MKIFNSFSVISRICRKIGSYWRDVARRLDIEEAYINDTENQYLHDEYSSEKMFKKVDIHFFKKLIFLTM